MRTFFITIFLLTYCSICCAENGCYIFLFGMSGAGKTTLMNQLPLHDEMSYVPVITVTRARRFDDDPTLFEYVSVEDYLESRKNGELFVDMENDKVCYGYKKKHLNRPEKNALLYGSPYFIDILKKNENSFFVLVETDHETGFIRQTDPQPLQDERKKINTQLSETFYRNVDFRQKMDLIFNNQFGDVTSSSLLFVEKINEMTNIKESKSF